MVLNGDEMELCWRWCWYDRPVQQTEMSVEEFYRIFCVWKEKMVRIGYPGDEENFVDDFMGGLRWNLRLRLCKYLSKPFISYDAFDRARFDETMMILEEIAKDIRTNKVLNEKPKLIPVDEFISQAIGEALGEDMNAKISHDRVEVVVSDVKFAISEIQESQAKFEGVSLGIEDQYVFECESKEVEAITQVPNAHMTVSEALFAETMMVCEVVSGKVILSVDETKVFEKTPNPFLLDKIRETRGVGVDAYFEYVVSNLNNKPDAKWSEVSSLVSFAPHEALIILHDGLLDKAFVTFTWYFPQPIPSSFLQCIDGHFNTTEFSHHSHSMFLFDPGGSFFALIVRNEGIQPSQ